MLLHPTYFTPQYPHTLHSLSNRATEKGLVSDRVVVREGHIENQPDHTENDVIRVVTVFTQVFSVTCLWSCWFALLRQCPCGFYTWRVSAAPCSMGTRPKIPLRPRTCSPAASREPDGSSDPHPHELQTYPGLHTVHTHTPRDTHRKSEWGWEKYRQEHQGIQNFIVIAHSLTHPLNPLMEGSCTSLYWIKVRRIWSVRLKTFLQSKSGMSS